MEKYNIEIAEIRKASSFAFGFMCLFILTGCAGTIMEPAQTVPVEASCDDSFSQTSDNTSCQGGVQSYEETEFVNYTQVAADYREYGERNPRDVRLTQAGAGNNLSASIPPTIEEEVLEYEEQISVSEGASDGNSTSSDEASAEDPVEDWLAEEGGTLKQTLTEWSDKSGWRLVWNTNRNYKITAGAMFRGRFADVSSALIRAFARARPAPIATFYKGNRVLVVETLEDENAYD
ncbi:MAG: toxin co-regulated pilus biosynthesis Q family protein [Alphaproteobacteria bacterium]|nr:toxin co-regulated pilus biosynthesis Q family protein [Alphaproteobacteria bacterium]